ncbi:VOC family protein [Leadbettera azotonutricia]|uniref:Glyoxalase family protein n=1 Tax=Leadbettera azotonutricia (strain ATCC BAA-888 / DSM 13862 / ZAS-9) TaxID=545695 RepID=F5YEY1_LEAAZ|nr:VOC family protein [Leadbettera azotonutricia]AEF82994.1 glyoxalase family protein [Leadbettera azotonutricia ZAS-9]
MAGTLGTQVVTQVGFVVKDAAKTKKKWAEFFGVKEPPLVDAGDYEITQTKYKGKAAPKAGCTMAFFDVGPNMQLELIQPNGEKSTWQEFLDKHGEGIHHIAFQVKGMDKVIKQAEGFGIKCAQRGKYGDASGEYAYLDGTKDLKCIVELLESFKK